MGRDGQAVAPVDLRGELACNDQETEGLYRCQPDNLDSLLSLIYLDGDPQILMPLYQLLARLIALPYHRKLLASWSPPQYILENRNTPQHLSAPTPGSSSSRPVILEHLISTITASSLSSLPSRKPNAKLLESALDLVAGIVKGQSALANLVRTWQSTDQSDVMSMSVDFSESGKTDKDRPMSEFMGTLSDLLTSTFTNVRIAAASCLTNIVKADKGSKTAERVRSTVMNLQILVGIISLLRSEGMEEKVKLCFILGKLISPYAAHRAYKSVTAALVSDDGNLQKSAADQGCPALAMQLFFAVDKGLDRGDFGMDVASRSKEVRGGAHLRVLELTLHRPLCWHSQPWHSSTNQPEHSSPNPPLHSYLRFTSPSHILRMVFERPRVSLQEPSPGPSLYYVRASSTAVWAKR